MAEGLDFVILAVLLVELATGKSENGEVIGVGLLELFVELLEAFELGGETALGGCVDDEDDLAV